MAQSPSDRDVEIALKDAEKLSDTGVLGKEQAKVYTLGQVHGFQRSEVADALGKKPSTVDNLLRQARENVTAAREFFDLLDGLSSGIRTDKLGHTHGVFVTGDGAFDDTGWLDAGAVQYDGDSPFELGLEIERGSPEDYDVGAVREIIDLVPYQRKREESLPLLGWFCAASFRRHLQKTIGLHEFPVLSVVGPSGSGKTMTLSTFRRLFGLSRQPASPTDTRYSLLSTVSATESLPAWYDGYKPDELADHELDKFHEIVRKSTKGRVETRGNADKSTTEFHLGAPVVVSGSEHVGSTGDPALSRQSVKVDFEWMPANQDELERPGAHGKLIGGVHSTPSGVLEAEGYPLLEHAFAWHQFVCRVGEEDIEAYWEMAREEASRACGNEGYYDEMTALVKFGLVAYNAFAASLGVEGMPVGQHEMPIGGGE